MPYKITVVKIETTDMASPTADAIATTEVFTQTMDDLNVPALVRSLNPATRKRKAKGKDVAT